MSSIRYTSICTSPLTRSSAWLRFRNNRRNEPNASQPRARQMLTTRFCRQPARILPDASLAVHETLILQLSFFLMLRTLPDAFRPHLGIRKRANLHHARLLDSYHPSRN